MKGCHRWCRRALVATLVLAAALLAAPRARPALAGANLVADGGFEPPAVPAQSWYTIYPAGARLGAWTVGGAGVDLTGTPYWQPADGGNSVDLSAQDAGALWQDLATTPGHTYTVAFALAGNARNAPAVKQLSVSFGAISRTFAFDTTGHTNGSMGWTAVAFTAVAAEPTTRLTFTSLTAGHYGPTIDGVSVYEGVQRFGDVPLSDPAAGAIEALAARGVINGCDASANPPRFCPNDPTLRHQMAAVIVRAIPGWAGETGLPNFTDNTDDTELMTRVGTLQRHTVVRGYQDEVCTSQGKTPPCYGPLDTVKYGQVLLFIARAMVEKGYWALQPDDRSIFPDQNGAPGADPNTDQQTKDHRMVVTYVHYVGNPPDVVDVHAPFLRAGVAAGGWGDDSTRSWFARAFWPAIRDH